MIHISVTCTPHYQGRQVKKVQVSVRERERNRELPTPHASKTKTEFPESIH